MSTFNLIKRVSSCPKLIRKLLNWKTWLLSKIYFFICYSLSFSEYPRPRRTKTDIWYNWILCVHHTDFFIFIWFFSVAQFFNLFQNIWWLDNFLRVWDKFYQPRFFNAFKEHISLIINNSFQAICCFHFFEGRNCIFQMWNYFNLVVEFQQFIKWPVI